MYQIISGKVLFQVKSGVS